MKRRLSSKRRAGAGALKTKLETKLASLIRQGKRHSSEFHNVDKRLTRVQNATRYR